MVITAAGNTPVMEAALESQIRSAVEQVILDATGDQLTCKNFVIVAEMTAPQQMGLEMIWSNRVTPWLLGGMIMDAARMQAEIRERFFSGDHDEDEDGGSDG